MLRLSPVRQPEILLHLWRQTAVPVLVFSWVYIVFEHFPLSPYTPKGSKIYQMSVPYLPNVKMTHDTLSWVFVL